MMFIYFFYVLLLEVFIVFDGFDFFICDVFMVQDGLVWKDVQGSFIYLCDVLMQVNVYDVDDQNQMLNDYSNGEKIQMLIDVVGFFFVGILIENEFEILLKLKNGVDDKEYCFVVFSLDGKIVGYIFDGEWFLIGICFELIWKGIEDSDNNMLEKCGMQVFCFICGMLIVMFKGYVVIEILVEGDLVMICDCGV